jgi:hypothetical protein
MTGPTPLVLVSSGAPFFVGVMPIERHSETVVPTTPGGLRTFNPPVPVECHKGLYQRVEVLRTNNFNPNRVGRE